MSAVNHYNGFYILDAQDKGGKEDPLKAPLDGIEKEITTLGGKVQGTQKMDRRRFERIKGDLDSGFYVNVSFSIATDKLPTLQNRLKLNKEVFRQFYLRAKLESKTKTKAKAVAA